MLGCGLHVDFSRSKCSLSVSHSQLKIFGLLIAFLSAHVQTSSVKCNSTVVSSSHRHCVSHKDGVHDLDCFGQNSLSGYDWKCVWKPGNQTGQKTYTLVIQQKKTHCREHSKLSALTEKVSLFEKYKLTAQVFENTERNCTKAFFTGVPHSLVRCGPPRNVMFRRHSRKLDVDVSWEKQEKNIIQLYSVKYKTAESRLWNEVQSQDGERGTVEPLNTSLVYNAQIHCVSLGKCSQCPWSNVYTIPPELTAQPVLTKLEDSDLACGKGHQCRLIVITWKFPDEQLHDGYGVTIGKASGEPPWERMTTSKPEIRLNLSYSEYQFNITAFNVSTSPAVSHTVPPRQDKPGVAAGGLNVTVHNDTTLTIYWKDDLIKNYVCFCVEWARRGQRAAYMSFYEDANNYKTFSFYEPLQPYERYSATLHTRPNRDTCNMNRINNSESTYGAALFYLTEGTPLSAPPNISSCNVTQSSATLQWSSIPEEQIRGFLLGYVIHITEQHHREARTVSNITVDSALNSYELRNLKSGTVYQVQVSGFTRAGSGVLSPASVFETNHQGYTSLSGIIATSVILAVVLIFASPMLKRAKVILWPSIPNPGNSNAVQKIDRAQALVSVRAGLEISARVKDHCFLNLTQALLKDTLQVEHWDANNLQIVGKEVAAPQTIPLLHQVCDTRTSPDVTSAWTQGSGGAITPCVSAASGTDTQRTEVQRSPFTFLNGYTTMEMFQQAVPQSTTGNTTVSHSTTEQTVDKDATLLRSALGYVGQDASSPVTDRKDTSTIL
ncbi:interleukin-31 receptor subunit alpha isoform X2 [Thalassophryne amazonica]|uniref:interleukin-31 receptor subunit alpha isoform X2 n=1 Tax=Thalassophryne amazonica TaxID=390379 RepID=UPI001471383B|nr:interleukin-31 receptor subunit alpha isoform X2 [Thalassophryne amazonica]